MIYLIKRSRYIGNSKYHLSGEVYMFCKNCGASIEENAKFCNECGTPTEARETQNQAPVNDTIENFKDAVKNTEDVSGAFDPADIQANKTMAALSYIIFFLPLLASPDSKFGRFHSNQGLLLLLISVAWGIVGSILMWIPFIGWLVSFVGWIAIVIIAIMAIVNTAGGKAKRLPFIGKVEIIK